MINLLKKGIQILNGELSQNEKLHVNAENEYLVMSCGAFHPRFLAKIKRCKGDNNKGNNNRNMNKYN
jgi:hypothetical protein